MTTIAYRDGVMAADSQATADWVVYRVSKLVRLPCGGVAGGCGSATECTEALRWLVRGEKGRRPKLKYSTIIVAYGDGRVLIHEGKNWEYLPVMGPAAIGSGVQAAMAAMLSFGASPERAVEAAAAVDSGTSGPVSSLTVGPTEKPKRASHKRK